MEDRKTLIVLVVLMLMIISIFAWQKDETKRVLTSFLGISYKTTTSISPINGIYVL